MKLMDRIQEVKRIPEQVDKASTLIAVVLGFAVAAFVLSAMAYLNSGRDHHAN